MVYQASKRLADRLQSIQPFYVMDILAQARQLEQQGRDIVHMEVGEPAFAMPEPILKAAQDALQSGACHYTPALGMSSLREALAAYYQRQGHAVSAQQVAVCTGSSAALLMTLSACINPGDKVICTDPGYPCNKHFVSLLDAEPLFMPLSAADGFAVSLDVLKQHWQEGVSAVMLASPANPTGACIDPAELRAIADFVASNNAYLIMDEIYSALHYGEPQPSLALHNSNTIVINSFSKYFGMTGWRIGWLLAAEDIIEAVDILAQNIYLAPPTLSQHAAMAAFDQATLAICEQRRLEFQNRRDYLVQALRDLGFKITHTPQGAFYIYAELPDGFDNSDEFCRDLLQQASVAVTPGRDFSQLSAQKFLRFTYTGELTRLQTGVERIAGYIERTIKT